jgi:hypothetical protein
LLFQVSIFQHIVILDNLFDFLFRFAIGRRLVLIGRVLVFLLIELVFNFQEQIVFLRRLFLELLIQLIIGFLVFILGKFIGVDFCHDCYKDEDQTGKLQ